MSTAGEAQSNNSLMQTGNFVPVAALTVFVVLLAFWWSSANPSGRLDKIETVASQLAKDVSVTYATIHAHEDLQARLLAQIGTLEKRDEEGRNIALSRAQFEAWKTERDLYLNSIMKRIEFIEARLVSREEHAAAVVNIKDRLEKLYELYRDLEKGLREDEMRNSWRVATVGSVARP